MDRWIRLMLAYLGSRSKKGQSQLTDEFLAKMRVWPTDVDLNIVNNSVYMLYLECARLQMLARTGALNVCHKSKLLPIIRAGSIQYLRPLKRGDHFTVKSRVVGCTDEYFYVTHEIVKGERVYVSALAIVGFLGKDGLRKTFTMMSEIGTKSVLTDKHDLVQSWLSFENAQIRRGNFMIITHMIVSKIRRLISGRGCDLSSVEFGDPFYPIGADHPSHNCFVNSPHNPMGLRVRYFASGKDGVSCIWG